METEPEIKNVLNGIAEELASDVTASGLDDGALEQLIWKKLGERSISSALGFREKLDCAREIFSNMRGCGVLDTLIADEDITEIMVNGPDRIFTERNGQVEQQKVRFDSEQKLLDVIQRIVGSAGREVNTASPIVDTRLPDGSRVNVVLPPVSLSGPVMTIRRFPREPMNFRKLLGYGSISAEAAEALKIFVRSGCNIFISGGTGSGKTSFLNALSDFIPPDERIVTVEDSAELKIKGIKNLVSLETRNANSSGNGRVSIRDLIRTSLRMRPDRIIVGEVRGAEALDMLQAMNTGHDGSISTGHANSAEDMLSRLETMVLEGNPGLPLTAVRQQIASALDISVHLSRLRDGSRKVTEISEITGIEDGEIRLNPLFLWHENGDKSASVSGILERTGSPLRHREKLERSGYGGAVI